MVNVTIGIPSRGLSQSLLRVLRLALQTNASEILVSINPPIGRPSLKSQVAALATQDSRLSITYQNKDLGLYGNFRFLIQNAEQKYFAFYCTDDELTKDLNLVASSMDEVGAVLGIPNWSTAEYHPEQLSFGMKEQGRLPVTDSRFSSAYSSIWVEPSWIFGIWNTTFLKGIWPSVDFDWLDCWVVSRALLKGSVNVDTPSETVIGTWNWAGKIPHAVDGQRHRPTKAVLKYLSSFHLYLFRSPILTLELTLFLRNLFTIADKLNNMIKIQKKNEVKL